MNGKNIVFNLAFLDLDVGYTVTILDELRYRTTKGEEDLMKTIYSREDLLALDDPFEYEVGLPIRIRELPASVIEEEIPDSREQLDRLLKDGYTLVIQKPRVPNPPVFAGYP